MINPTTIRVASRRGRERLLCAARKRNPTIQPPQAERTSESKKLTAPTPAVGQRNKPPPLKSSSPAIITTAKGPGEFKVLNTRTSNGSNWPIERFLVLSTQYSSQAGA